MKRFAESTTVPISRSREEIMRLLREWKADRIAWADDFTRGRAVLQFIWHHDGLDYGAEIAVQLATDEELQREATNEYGRTWPGRLAKLRDDRGKREHRLLLLWLKAALNAVDAGIVSAETIFLPFLKGKDGRTVAEAALPRMKDLLAAPAGNLLGRGDVHIVGWSRVVCPLSGKSRGE